VTQTCFTTTVFVQIYWDEGRTFLASTRMMTLFNETFLISAYRPDLRQYLAIITKALKRDGYFIGLLLSGFNLLNKVGIICVL
jgi:hypothetical protein